MSGIFDPIDGRPYGSCNSCGEVLATEDAANEHMRRTLDEARGRGQSRSHGIRVTNASRPQRIRSRVGQIVEDAIHESMGDFDRLVERGDLTEAELADALRRWPDFADVREEWSE